jgi:hypothetical protein
MRFSEEAAYFERWNSFAEQETLALLASLLKKGFLLLTAFDAFRGDRQPETKPKPRQSTDNDRALGLRPHCLDKATIDLDLVELEITILMVLLPLWWIAAQTRRIQRQAKYAGARTIQQKWSKPTLSIGWQDIADYPTA